MCKFKSAIVVKDEQEKSGFRLLMSPFTESHSDLEQLFNLKDGARLNYAKVEFSPTDFSTAHQLETYKLEIDEDRTPDWFNDEIKDRVIEKMTSYIKTIIINDERKTLLGGQWILGPNAQIGTATNVLINICNGGTITNFVSGTINTFTDGDITTLNGGIINHFHSGDIANFWIGTITCFYNGTITNFVSGTINYFWNGTLTNFVSGIIGIFGGGTLTNFVSGTITSFEGGTIANFEGGTICLFEGGTITNIECGTATTVEGGTVTSFKNGTIITRLYEEIN